jgi:uncharacterized protein YlaN (UPF0358 family)
MGIQIVCVDCHLPIGAGLIRCPSCNHEVSLVRLNEGIDRLTRSVQTAIQLGLLEEANDFRRLMLDYERELMELTA